MAQISANALFHFTPKLEWLASILEFGFKPRYCEEFNTSTDAIPEFIDNACIPMTCFCDIPLSNIAKHACHYGGDAKGGYGIGLKKNERFMQRLNPVLYFNKSSDMIKIFEDIYNHQLNAIMDLYKLEGEQVTLSQEHLRINKIRTDIGNSIDLFTKFQAYIKPYQSKEGYRYYDEKEWRYIPDFYGPPFVGKPYSHVEHPFLLRMKDDIRERSLEQKERLNQSINKNPHLWLKFNVEDIKYLIVKNDNDIHILIDILRSINKRTGKFPVDLQDLISSRIITCEQIFEDY